MANSIALVKKYVDKLDDVMYVLESDASTARQGKNANEIIVPKIDMDGLADYSRSGGYVEGDDKLTWEMVKSENLSDGSAVCNAITTANNVLDEAEVDAENRILFITPTLHNAIIALDTYKSKAMLAGFSAVVKVPQTRFYTAIDLLDGKTTGEEIGGYKKATAGKNINFMIIDKSAILQFTKHIVNKIISPEDNQTADAWKFFYRAYGLTDVYKNKVKGIYCSHSTT